MAREILERVRGYIQDGLTSGSLATGQKLPAEREFADRFGTSRATIRQALMILETENRVTRHVGRGTYIAEGARERSGSIESVLEGLASGAAINTSPGKLMEARQLFEPHLMELVVVNATEGDLRAIRAVLAQQQDMQETEAFEDSDIAFHEALARATHNELVVALSDLIISARHNRDWRRLKAAVAQRHGGRRADAVTEHAEVVSALEERNAAEAVIAMRRHLERVRFNLLGY